MRAPEPYPRPHRPLAGSRILVVRRTSPGCCSGPPRASTSPVNRLSPCCLLPPSPLVRQLTGRSAHWGGCSAGCLSCGGDGQAGGGAPTVGAGSVSAELPEPTVVFESGHEWASPVSRRAADVAPRAQGRSSLGRDGTHAWPVGRLVLIWAHPAQGLLGAVRVAPRCRCCAQQHPQATDGGLQGKGSSSSRTSGCGGAASSIASTTTRNGPVRATSDSSSTSGGVPAGNPVAVASSVVIRSRGLCATWMRPPAEPCPAGHRPAPRPGSCRGSRD